jgi:hypothetical protein
MADFANVATKVEEVFAQFWWAFGFIGFGSCKLGVQLVGISGSWFRCCDGSINFEDCGIFRVLG